MKHINSGRKMRIAVCDLSTGDLDILLLDSDAEKSFDSYEDASEFFEDLGYDINCISWMDIMGIVKEERVTTKNGSPVFKD